MLKYDKHRVLVIAEEDIGRVSSWQPFVESEHRVFSYAEQRRVQLSLLPSSPCHKKECGKGWYVAFGGVLRDVAGQHLLLAVKVCLRSKGKTAPIVGSPRWRSIAADMLASRYDEMVEGYRGKPLPLVDVQPPKRRKRRR